MLGTTAYEFVVSAPVPETYAWLYGRAVKSGEVFSAAAAQSEFQARWAPGGAAPAMLEVKVRADAGGSRVTVAMPATTEAGRALIEDFAGPLGNRMTGLRQAPAGFFDPPMTRGEKTTFVACMAIFGVLMLASVMFATRFLVAHEDDDDVAGREAFVNLVVPFVASALVAGVIAGLAVRRRGRWYEAPAVALVGGFGLSFAIFLVWSIGLDEAAGSSEPEPGAHPFALALGAGLGAVLETLLLTLGVCLGRTPWLLIALGRRLAR
jgi:hypothetical protein